MTFKKLILSATFAVSSINAGDKIALSKDNNLSVQLAYLDKHDSIDRKFEFGTYFGELLKYKPEYLSALVKHYKYKPEKDTLFIALKKAGIKNTYYKEENNYRIIDPMSYKKYYYNSVKVLIGSYKFHLDEKYINKIQKLEGCTYGLCTIPANNLRKEYGLKIKEVKTKKDVKNKNTTKPIDLPF